MEMSFGSILWPPVPEYVDEVLETLLEKRVPFVRFEILFHEQPDSIITFILDPFPRRPIVCDALCLSELMTEHRDGFKVVSAAANLEPSSSLETPSFR